MNNKKLLLPVALIAALTLTACDRTVVSPPPVVVTPTPTPAPAPSAVVVPGPAGPAGAPGPSGAPGADGAPGKGDTVIIVPPEPAKEPAKN